MVGPRDCGCGGRLATKTRGGGGGSYLLMQVHEENSGWRGLCHVRLSVSYRMAFFKVAVGI